MYTRTKQTFKLLTITVKEQLTKDSITRAAKDIKRYCDDQKMVMLDEDYEWKPIAEEQILRSLLTDTSSGYIEHDSTTLVRIRVSDELDDDIEFYYQWTTRWENDYEGTEIIWQKNISEVVSDYLYEHPDDYKYEVVEKILEEKDM